MAADGPPRRQPLAERVASGDPAALARALTRAENGDDALVQTLRPTAGRAAVIGVTGPPGAGKSTLLNALIREWRTAGRRVALLAVDPVSPLTGGAVLGDRTRMGEHSLDDGVFIRSLSARGHLGGLSATTHRLVDVLDAAGWDLILLETVGTGQSETEVAEQADVTVVVSAPGLGDDIQAIKAGVLEIADILVVNKADRPDADRTARDLSNMVELRSASARREVPVMQTVASDGTGVSKLRMHIDQAAKDMHNSRHARRLTALRLAIADTLAQRLRAEVRSSEQLDDVLEGVSSGALSMVEALRMSLDRARLAIEREDS